MGHENYNTDMERKKITCKIEGFSTAFLFTRFDKAAKLLLEKKVELEKMGWTNVHLKCETYYDSTDLSAYGTRFENDEEYNKRLKILEKKTIAAAKRESRERKKYEELKLKYGQK